MSKMKLSIIIPMYNVELYIEQCLQSCLNQNVSKETYEIIVVNDGSTDRSLQIAEHIAAQAANVYIITQSNGGLSMARNVGLQNAKGEYVWFVDADDRIQENCLCQLIKKCDYDKLDILAVGAGDVVKGQVINRFVYPYENVVTGGDVLDDGHMQHCVPFTIYCRKFLLHFNLYFYPNIYHEDTEFSPRAYFFAKRVGFINEIFYYVTINPNSITRTVNYKKSFDCLKVAISIHDFSHSVANGEHATFFHNYISLVINNSLANFMEKGNDYVKRKKTIELFSRQLCDTRYLFIHLRKSSILKYKVEGNLFTIFPKYVFFIYKILRKIKF